MQEVAGVECGRRKRDLRAPRGGLERGVAVLLRSYNMKVNMRESRDLDLRYAMVDRMAVAEWSLRRG